MLDWFSDLFCSSGKSTAEKLEEMSHPEYIQEEWPYLDVPIGKEDKIKLQFQQNGIEYKGPNNDSYHRKSPAPPISMIFYFKTEKELKKAAYVVWESDVELIGIVKEGGDEVLNSATELYEYMDKSQEVEIV